jgi:hypothetical protein
MLMKNLVLILTLIMIGQLTAPAGAKQPLPQTARWFWRPDKTNFWATVFERAREKFAGARRHRQRAERPRSPDFSALSALSLNE